MAEQFSFVGERWCPCSQWIMLKVALILAASMVISADSLHSSRNKRYSVFVDPFTKYDGMSPFLISLVIVLGLCVVLLILACICFRLDRRLIDACRRAKARFQSYGDLNDSPSAKHAASFDLTAERKNFSSGKPKTSISDSLKKTADVFADRLQRIDQRKYSSPPTYEYATQVDRFAIGARRDSEAFHRSFKENVEKSNSFRAGEGVKMSEELMRQYRERKSFGRRKFSTGSNDSGRRLSAVRKYSGDTEIMQRKLSAMKKYAAAGADVNQKATALRRLPGCGSDGDLCKWSAAYRHLSNRPNKPRLRKLAGHNSFLAYEHEDRFSSPWEARASLLDPKRTDELATMSECELDSYCIYFNVEEWQQVKYRWKLARNCKTIDEEQSDNENDEDLMAEEKRYRSNTLGNMRRPSFRSMLKTVPYGADSRQPSLQMRSNSSEDDSKNEETKGESEPSQPESEGVSANSSADGDKQSTRDSSTLSTSGNNTDEDIQVQKF